MSVETHPDTTAQNQTFDPTRCNPAELREAQDRNFRRQMQLVFAAHPYYQASLEQAHLKPEDFQGLDDLEKLPLTYKTDYMKNPLAFRLNPLPDMTPHERIIWDLSYTTGTTSGVPTPFYNTTYDYFGILHSLKKLCEITDIRATDCVMNLFPLTPVPHIGFLRTRDYATVVGASVVSALTGTPFATFPVHNSMDHAIKMIEQHRATVLSGIVSYVRRVVMRAEELGADFSSVRLASALGEPCPRGMREDMRRRLRNLGAKGDLMIGNALGFTEMQGSTGECVELGGGHNPAPDRFFFEVVDEQTGKRLADGERGLFVVTHLDRRGTVLLRYVLGDICAISNEACPHCGRIGQRVISNVIRTKELVKLKGTLVNPDVMKEAIATIDGIDEYQIIFTKENLEDPYSLDKLVVRIATSTHEAAREQLVEALRQRMQEAAEMRPVIEFAQMSEIFDPSKTLKSTRVIDLRPVEE